MEYTVVRERSMKTLITRVNQLIKEGWKPQGGISWVNDIRSYHMQAMIMLEDKPMRELGRREPLKEKESKPVTVSITQPKKIDWEAKDNNYYDSLKNTVKGND